jgi:hypothetical protein
MCQNAHEAEQVLILRPRPGSHGHGTAAVEIIRFAQIRQAADLALRKREIMLDARQQFVLPVADPFVYAAASQIPDDPDRAVTSAAAKPPAASAQRTCGGGAWVSASCRAWAWRAQSRDTSQDCRDDPPGQRPTRQLGLRPRPRRRGRRGHTRPPRRVAPGCVHHLFGVRTVGHWRSRCWRSTGAARRFGRCRCGPSVPGAWHTGVGPCNRSPRLGYPPIGSLPRSSPGGHFAIARSCASGSSRPAPRMTWS